MHWKIFTVFVSTLCLFSCIHLCLITATDDESRPVVGKVLSKWRPQEIDQPIDQTKQEGPSLLNPQANGIKSAVLLENVADPELQVNAPVVQQQQQQQYPEVGAAAG